MSQIHPFLLLTTPSQNCGWPVVQHIKPGTGPKSYSFGDTLGLTAALRRGEEEAYRWLHREWNGRLFSYSFVLARGDANAASEIVQATYLRTLRQVRPLSDENALWNWMACAARSAAIDRHRKQNRYRDILDRFARWFGSDQHDVHVPDFRVSAEERLRTCLEHCLSSLDPKARDLVEARYFGGEPIATIASARGLNTRAVEGRLARTREKLRLCMSMRMKKEQGSDED